MDFLETLKDRVIVLDGAMGTMIQALDLEDLDFGGPEFRMLSDLLTFSRAEALRGIHLAYYQAGANAVETNTFGASPLRLAEYDFSDIDLSRFADIPGGFNLKSADYEEISHVLSKAGAEIACQAREHYRRDPGYDGRPLFVIGSIGPSNRVISNTDADLRRATYDEIAGNFYHQVTGLIDGGVDAVLFETQQDILEVKAGVSGAHRAFRERGIRLPIMIQVTVDQFSKMQIFNTDIQAALTTVQDIGIDTFGINCSIGPDLMVKTVETLSRYSKIPISVVPNAGLPVSENGRTVYTFSPDNLADYLHRFVTEFGVNVVGGCCGTGPDHIRAVATKLHGIESARRTPDERIYVSGPQNAIPLESSETLLRVGERLNVRGSSMVRSAVENDGPIDHDALEEVVHEQTEELGLTIIDVCMDSNIVDTTAALKEVIYRQTVDFSGAMSIDSFDVDSLREAVKVYPGRPVINSMSLEEVADGVTKIQAVIEATRDHSPVYIALTADREGPAATREKKHELARRIVEEAGRFGVGPDRILVDMNVFPLGSESQPGTNFALESLESIPLIKSIHPQLKTICGIGNLTNGLASKPYMRKVLTSVWLDEGRKRGLDAAIVNPNHYVFVEDLDRHDYDLALRAILERDLDAFEDLERIAEAKKGNVAAKRTSYDDLSVEEAICRKIVDGYKDRVSGSITIEGHEFSYTDRIVLQAAKAIETHAPLEFVNDYLMVAMKELGDGFARGEVSLPHLLKSADVMKHVMGFLEQYMQIKSGRDIHEDIEYKGTIVLGTVYQDVHSIGKDLAKTLFENYGYRVIDLGVMTPLQQYLDTAKQEKADAIGMSALLVQTSNHMITVAKMLAEQGMGEIPLLIGGAPVSERHAAYVAKAAANGSGLKADVFYCPTAMDGVNVMNELTGGGDTTPLLEKNRERLRSRLERAERRVVEDEQLRRTLPRRKVSFEAHTLPASPWVAPEYVHVPLLEFRDRIDKRNLFSLNWKFGGATMQRKHGTTPEELERLFEEWTRDAAEQGWIQPAGVVAVFPCNSDGDELAVFDRDNPDEELCRFDFNVVIGAGKEDTISAAQYFRPVESGERDAVGLQISNTGPAIEAQLLKFKQSNESESALYLQGLSDRIAEDMAEYLHHRLRNRVGLNGTTGTRWSPGYPAITNTENNRKILRLLGAADKLGVTVTDAGEFHPTGCTAAIVSFHPDARYM